MHTTEWSSKKRAAYAEGVVSTVVNTIFFFVKYYLGTLYNSIAVTADAFHTLSDSLTSMVLIIGYRIADKPPDGEHPFGHGRAELISGVIIGVLLGVVAYNFMTASYEKLVSGIPLEYSDLLVIALVAFTLAKAGLTMWAYRLGTSRESRPIVADAWHHASDSAATGLLALSIYLGKNYWWLDGVLGIAISVLIFVTAGKVIYDASSELLGKAPSRVELDKLAEVIRKAHPLAERVHHVHFHRYGNHVEVTLHMNLPGNMTLKEAHDIATSVEKAIKKKLGYEATVHVEPGEHVD
ncbi:MAG: cation diffusion facilitator family transporter [Desulfurococcaceae archaeon]